MRNALVVLVPLCFGLTSGFIVPPGVLEVTIGSKENVNMMSSSTSNPGNLREDKNKYPELNMTNTIITNVNDSLNTDLYEHSQTKDDIQQRSFVYIKQRGKKPLINLYNPLIPLYHFKSNNRKFNLINIDSIFEDIPGQFSIAKYIFNTETDFSDIANHRCHAKKKDGILNNLDENSKSNKLISNEQREYLELLKAPLLRPTYQITDDKNKLDKILLNHVNNEVKNKNSAHLNKILPQIDNFVTVINENVTPVSSNVRVNIQDETKQKYYLNTDCGIKSLVEKIIKPNTITQNEIESHDFNTQTISRNDFISCRDCVNNARKYNLNKLQTEEKCNCDHNLVPRKLEKDKKLK